MERLQKFLAQAGVASRRQAEEMIRQGLITVNGEAVMEMGIKIDSVADKVCVGGKEVVLPQVYDYLMLNKPVHVVTTRTDPQQRTTVIDLLKNVESRVYPVGRLDYMTEGLLLLTNDGELAHRLMHPSYKVEKTYLVKVREEVSNEAMLKLRRGVLLEDGVTAPATVRKAAKDKNSSTLEIIIHEGRNRQIRRMCQALGLVVLSLKRVRFGPLTVGNLQPGEYRHLTDEEIKAIKNACRMK